MTEHKLAALAAILLFISTMAVCPVMGCEVHSEDTFYPSEPVCLSEDAPDLNAEILPLKEEHTWGDTLWNSPWSELSWSEKLERFHAYAYIPELIIGTVADMYAPSLLILLA